MSVNISNSMIPNSTTAVGITSSLKTMFISEGENLVNIFLYLRKIQQKNVKSYGKR
jgi:hypothetical protein